jgi:hypothetical protein
MPALAIAVTSFFNYKNRQAALRGTKQWLLNYKIPLIYIKITYGITVIKKDRTESAA